MLGMQINLIGIRLLAAVVFVGGCTPAESPPSKPPTYVGAQVCATCHESEYARWQNSHHDLAMQHATEQTVLGNFDNVKFQYGSVESTLFRRDGRFLVSTDNANGEIVEHEILYTFGVEPLQQYLVQFPDGRLQTLGMSWDARPTADGGQRWFHIYPDEQVDHTDPLHWTGPLQNWNFMCAECHSTNVRKNYAPSEDTFATAWSELNVACEACHGPGSTHAAQADASLADGMNGEYKSSLVSLERDGSWNMDAETGIARLSPAQQSTTEIETCARCHSRRSIVSEDYVHGDPLMNTHRPSLLREGLYYADGQIQDEVYVYGSFLQSAMYRAGVTCSDCHDAHSLQLKAPGNSLCAQCHLPAVFDTKTHHQHEQASDGAQCVNCHMPSRDYMVIDGRRDHSFRVPSPDLSARIGTPNACNSCHSEQAPEWATGLIRTWFGENQGRHYGDVIEAGRRGALGSSADLAALADDESTANIVRATAIQLLGNNPGPQRLGALSRASQSEDALIRMAAADAANALEPTDQVRINAPLLTDTVRAVRLAAAGSLMHIPRMDLLQSQANDLAVAVEEYRAAQLLNADRAEANVNLGMLYTLEDDSLNAIQAYERAIEIMPSFSAAYINLADFFRAAGRESDVEETLNRGLTELPDNADLHHALGLAMVRRGDYESAIASLRRANEFQPEHPRFAYVLGVALNSTGDSAGALAVLKSAHSFQPSDRDLLIALATMSRDAELYADALEFSRKLLALAPDDPLARQLIEELSQR